jgi:hypothetical protein
MHLPACARGRGAVSWWVRVQGHHHRHRRGAYTDRRIASAFRAAGEDVGKRLEKILCPVHKKAATRVRIHFDARGAADLQYDSCCEKLGEEVGRALG